MSYYEEGYMINDIYEKISDLDARIEILENKDKKPIDLGSCKDCGKPIMECICFSNKEKKPIPIAKSRYDLYTGTCNNCLKHINECVCENSLYHRTKDLLARTYPLIHSNPKDISYIQSMAKLLKEWVEKEESK